MLTHLPQYLKNALDISAQRNNFEMFKCLYEEGGSPELESRYKYRTSPLEYACGFGNLDMVKYFTDTLKIQAHIKRSLHFACLGGHLGVVEYLMI